MLVPVDVWISAKRVEKDLKTSSGLFLPQHAVEQKHMAVVTGIGPNVKIAIKVGDKVVFGRYAGDEFEGEMLIKEDEVMAIYKETT